MPYKYRINIEYCSAVVGLLLAFHCAQARSVEPDAAANVDPPLETITVYARRLEPVTRVAATVTVIRREAIERMLATDAKQLVRYEPGLSVRNDPFRFGLDSFAVRGVGGNRVAVEVDGIPAAGAFSIGAYADSGRSVVDLAFVDRVEVLRGPASSLYGSDAIGGVVAMTTLMPQDLLRDDTGRAMRVETGYAAQDDGWHAALIGAATVGTVDVLLGYVHRDGSESATAADVTPNPRDYSADSLLLRTVYPAAAAGPLSFTIEGGRIRQDTSVDALLGTPPRFTATTSLFGDDSTERFRVDLGQRLDEASWFDTADWRVYWQGTDTRQDTFELRKAVPPRTPPLQIDRAFRLEERTVGVESTVLREVETATLQHALVYGLEAACTSLEELRDGLQTNLETGATSPTILGETMPVRDFPPTDLTEIGIFVQDEIRAGSSRWTVIPALRTDYYRLEPQPDPIYLADNPSSPAVGIEELSLAPKLGATWTPGGGATAFLQYAHGFRSPPPEDVNIGFELPLLNFRAIPNPDLKPERSDGIELGLRWHGAAGNLTASSYYNEYRDFIESRVNLGPDPDTGVIQFQSQNIAEARIYGAELAATFTAPADRPSLAGWSGRLAASWSRGEDMVRDVPLNSIDPPTAVLAVAYAAAPRSSAGRWGVEVVTTAVQGKHDVAEIAQDLFETDGYLLLDLMAHVDLGRGFRLQAGLFNLTDVEYIEWADVRGRPAGDPLLPYYTRPGRNLSVTLHWQPRNGGGTDR